MDLRLLLLLPPLPTVGEEAGQLVSTSSGSLEERESSIGYKCLKVSQGVDLYMTIHLSDMSRPHNTISYREELYNGAQHPKVSWFLEDF